MKHENALQFVYMAKIRIVNGTIHLNQVASTCVGECYDRDFSRYFFR